MKISIIMPAYNEGPRIYDSVAETMQTMEGLGLNQEIIVVDDGSRDNTFEEAQRASSQFSDVIAVRYTNNGGKGNAIKYGFRHVTGDLVAFLDADLDLHPRQIKTLLEIMESEHADVVIGSKRHPLSELDYPLQRRFLSTGYSLIIKALFDLSVRDTQTGIKLFRHDVLEEIFPRILSKRYAFDLEVLVNAHHLGYKVAEAPIILNFKRGRFGRIGLREIEPIAVDTAVIFYRLRILNYFGSGDNERRSDINHNSPEVAK